MQRAPVFLAVGLTASMSLTACATAPASESAMRTGSVQDEDACRAAVFEETGNADAVVLGSELAEANTEVIVGVGPQRAEWRCLVSNGLVVEVMSLTEEGAL